MTPFVRHDGPGAGSLAFVLSALSALLLGVRLFAAGHVGFGDAEALYAAYAVHPQPAYLDHPGLIGLIARAVGGGTAPTPWRAHVVTSALATAYPWVMAFLCRAAGAPWERALGTALIVALVPETAIGLFAMTPDLPLALLWTSALGFASIGLAAPPGSTRASWAFASAGLLAGGAASAKVTGVLLLAALVVTYALPPARAHARTVAPWAGLLAALVILLPIAAFERRNGWPLLVHRLDDSQRGAGLSFRNVAAFVGGQVVYLSPVVAVLIGYAARAAWRGRHDVVGALLLSSSVVPAATLLPLVLWSRVAEPHWVAPALLSLAPAIARAEVAAPRRLVVAAASVSAAFVAAAHVWVLSPWSARLAATAVDTRIDISNELYGWPDVLRAVRDEVAVQASPGLEGVSVVGPHWVICAQLDADLRGEVHVGCDTPTTDDFDTWWPRAMWRNADSIVWVTDERFGPGPALPLHAVDSIRRVRIERGGHVVRTFTITTFVRRAVG